MGMKALFFYTILFLLIFTLCAGANYYDFDLWARLIAGMGPVEAGHVLKEDFLSYTPVHTWWDHEWGSGVIFYLLLKYFGAYSLVLFNAFLVFLIFFIITKIIKLRTNVCPYNFTFYFFAVMAVISNFNCPIRCHMFSFLLFTVFIYILELARKGKNKPMFLIPFIVIFWNNVHGGVVSGLGLMFMYAVGEFLNKKPVKKYLIAFLTSLAALFINPWGFDYIKFLFMANTMQRPDVMEWWGPFSKYYALKQIPFKIYLVFTACVEVIKNLDNIKAQKFKHWWQNADKVKGIVLLATFYLALAHVKLIPFYIIAAMCFVYEDFYKLIERMDFPKWKDKVIYGIIIFLALFTFAAKDIVPPVNLEIYPVKEIEFIKINNIKGNLLINFGLGSYASYKLYPHNKIFMDGRYEEVYYDDMVPMLKKFFLVNREDWNEAIIKYPPDVMVLEKYYPIYELMKTSQAWSLVYEGQTFGVFVPQKIKKEHYKMPSNDIEHYKNTLFDTDIKLK